MGHSVRLVPLNVLKYLNLNETQNEILSNITNQVIQVDDPVIFRVKSRRGRIRYIFSGYHE